MGTSASYHPSLKGKPEWGDLSRTVTHGCNGQNLADEKMKGILSKYVNVVQGASKAGGGRSKIMGKAGLQSAGRIGTFLSGLLSNGYDFEKTLNEIGITDLSGKKLSDIIDNLIEYCSGPASTIDDKAAKEATRLLLEELFEKAKTVEELKEQLKATLNEENLEEIIVKYFGYYVYEHLSVMFYEKLTKQKGDKNRGKLFKRIKDFIVTRLQGINKKNPLKNLDWGSEKANELMQKILTEVLTVFE